MLKTETSKLWENNCSPMINLGYIWPNPTNTELSCWQKSIIETTELMGYNTYLQLWKYRFNKKIKVLSDQMLVQNA